MSRNTDLICSCGSGKSPEACCLPVIAGKRRVETAEQLMRSRYTAYVLGDEAYLLSSWHAHTRPEFLPKQAGDLNWTGLVVCRIEAGNPGDKHADVEFVAHYEQGGKVGKMHENSHFVFEQGNWFYVDGEEIISEKMGRNSLCYCGSGKKFKKCCATR